MKKICLDVKEDEACDIPIQQESECEVNLTLEVDTEEILKVDASDIVEIPVPYPIGYSHNSLRDRELPDQHPISSITGLKQKLDSKVDKKTGEGLMTDAERAKLKGIETGAQVNKIEVIKVNGVLVPISKKTADLDIELAGELSFDPVTRELTLLADDGTVLSTVTIPGKLYVGDEITIHVNDDTISIHPDIIAEIESTETGLANHILAQDNPHKVTKAQVGLDKVDNTADADKPISTATQAAIDAEIVLREAGDSAVQSALDTHKTDVDNPHEVTKAQVGLGNVDNTSDADKPVSTAQQTVLDAKLDKDFTTDVLTGADVVGDAVQVKMTVDKINPSSGVTGSFEKTFPVADTSKMGMMAPEQVTQINANTSDIEALKGRTIRYMITLAGATTQDLLTAAYLNRSPKPPIPPLDGTTLVNTVDNKEFTWFTSEGKWVDRGVTTVNLATNDSPGIVQGSLDKFKVQTEGDGTMSVNGLDALEDTVNNSKQSITDHVADKNNPHEVTKAQVGLGNVDNTSDAQKPVSTATQEALDTKASTANLSALEGVVDAHKQAQDNPHKVTAVQVGLGNVDNTSDKDKPISNATQLALDAIAPTASFNDDKRELTVSVNGKSDTVVIPGGELKWGAITGNIVDQSDLGDELDKKVDVAQSTADVGKYMKVGADGNLIPADLPAAEAVAWGNIKGTLADQIDLNDALAGKATTDAVEAAQADATQALVDAKTANDALPNKADNASLIPINEAIEALEAKDVSQDEVIATKVDKVNGKGLSDQNYTLDEKNKLKGVAIGAQVNVIEKIQKNGVDISPTDKTVNITIPTTTGELNNNSDFITSASVTEKLNLKADQSALDTTNAEVAKKVDKVTGKGLSTNDYTTTEKNKLDGIAAGAQVNVIESISVNDNPVHVDKKSVNIHVPTRTSELTNDSNLATNAYVDVAVRDKATTEALEAETTAREQADTGLQSQIDAIVARADVVDIVATKAALDAYGTGSLSENDIIKVLKDETHANASTYYRWVEGAWVYIGEDGEYYTKSAADAQFVPQTRTINKKALSGNIELTASDVNALDKTGKALTAGRADSAEKDLSGNIITEYYATKDELAGKQDSGDYQPAGDYATKSELTNGLAGKQDAGDYATDTALNEVKITADGAVQKSGDTMTGNLTVGSAKIGSNGYIEGTWLKTTGISKLSTVPDKIAVVDPSGWVYYNDKAQVKEALGVNSKLDKLGGQAEYGMAKGTRQVRNIILETADPSSSDCQNGDVWANYGDTPDVVVKMHDAWTKVADVTSVAQDANGVSINGTALQDADTGKDGLMTKEQVIVLNGKATDIAVVHKDGAEEISGTKTFMGGLQTVDVTQDELTSGQAVAPAPQILGVVQTALKGKLDKSGGTLTGPITINGGDNQGIILPEDGNINAPGNRTVMGFLSGTFTVNNPAFGLNLRGSGTRPTYNGSEMALKSDVGDVSGVLKTSGGAMTGYLADKNAKQVRNIYFADRPPTDSEGVDGDIWITPGE